MVLDYQEGNFASYTDDASLKAEVRTVSNGRVVCKFSGETAWMDAQRKVMDLALEVLIRRK